MPWTVTSTRGTPAAYAPVAPGFRFRSWLTFDGKSQKDDSEIGSRVRKMKTWRLEPESETSSKVDRNVGREVELRRAVTVETKECSLGPWVCREDSVSVTADSPGVAPVAPLNYHYRGETWGAWDKN